MPTLNFNHALAGRYYSPSESFTPIGTIDQTVSIVYSGSSLEVGQAVTFSYGNDSYSAIYEGHQMGPTILSFLLDLEKATIFLAKA